VAAKMRRGSRRAIRFARLEPERIAPLHTGVLIATFHCDAPARCEAFGDRRRIVVTRTVGASLVASFAVWNVRALERIAAFHTGVLIATFGCNAPARCGAVADERRIVVRRRCKPANRISSVRARATFTCS
jgi:hypothetical protein